MITGEYKIEFEYKSEAKTNANCTIIIPLYNYQKHIIEALTSVFKQKHKELDLIIVNDKSTDKSLKVAKKWLAKHTRRFSRALIVSHKENQGLSISRNTGTSLSQTPFLFFLDADNTLFPKCITTHVEALIKNPKAYFAYSIIELFENKTGLIGTECFSKDILMHGNYIDAMACIRKDALIKLGGYTIMPGKFGWEDYELWLKICDAGGFGVHIPQILSRYREHGDSMKSISTNHINNNNEIRAFLSEKFPWTNLPLLHTSAMSSTPPQSIIVKI